MSIMENTLSRGMEAQLAHWRQALRRGEQRLGWKIGFNDPAARDKFSLPRPLVGYLTESTRLDSGAAYRAEPGAKILLEAELALRVNRNLQGSVSPAEASAAIDALAPAIELVDMSEGVGDFEAVLGGNIFHRAVVLGAPVQGRGDVAGNEVQVRVSVDGVERCQGEPEQRLPRDLGELVRLVAETLDARGEGLAAGDWIISGSITTPLALEPGQEAVADLGWLGSVSVRLQG